MRPTRLVGKSVSASARIDSDGSVQAPLRAPRRGGSAQGDREAAQRPSDGDEAGAPSGALRARRCRPFAGAVRAGVDDPPAPRAVAHPRTRQEGRRGAEPGEPDRPRRARAARLRRGPGDDGQSRFRRAGVPARSAAEDQGAAQPVRAARARAVDRGRRRTGRRDAWRAVEAGADAIVAGTAILGASDCAAAIARLRSAPPPVA